VRLPKQVLEQAGLSEGVPVELVVEAGTVVLRPAKPHYDIATLVASITPENLPESLFGHVVRCLGWGTHALAPLSFPAGTYSGVFTRLPMLTGQGAPRRNPERSRKACRSR
jgi:hypothetical protein